LELVGDGRSLHGGGGCPERLSRCRAEFQRVVAKHHQNAAGGSGKRYEADLDGVGHKQILQIIAACAAKGPESSRNFGFGTRDNPLWRFPEGAAKRTGFVASMSPV